MNRPSNHYRLRPVLRLRAIALALRVGLAFAAAHAIVVVLAVALLGAMSAAAATPCEKLSGLSLQNAKIDSAQTVPAGAFTQPGRGGGARGAANVFANLPAFCRLTATLT